MVMVYWSAAAGQRSFHMGLWMAVMVCWWKPGKSLAAFVLKTSERSAGVLLAVWWMVREEMDEVKF